MLDRFSLDAGYPNGDGDFRRQIVIGFAAPLDALQLGNQLRQFATCFQYFRERVLIKREHTFRWPRFCLCHIFAPFTNRDATGEAIALAPSQIRLYRVPTWRLVSHPLWPVPVEELSCAGDFPWRVPIRQPWRECFCCGPTPDPLSLPRRITRRRVFAGLHLPNRAPVPRRPTRDAETHPWLTC